MEYKEGEINSGKLEHEDRIYFTVLISLLAIAVSLVFSLHGLGVFKSLNIIFYAIIPLMILIFFFTVLRFIAVIFEDNTLRYMGIHGLIFFISLYFILGLLLSFGVVLSQILPTIFIIVRTLFLGYLTLFFWFPDVPIISLNYLSKRITEKLVQTNKYNATISSYEPENVDKMCLNLYLSPLYIILLSLFLYAVWTSSELVPEDLFLKVYTSIIAFLFLSGGFYSFINFKRLKNRESPLRVPPFHEKLLIMLLFIPVIIYNIIIEILKFLIKKIKKYI